MIGIDTNVLVRFLVQDDDKQSRAANRFFESKLNIENRGFISTIVLAELCWVLRYSYHLTDNELLELVRSLLETPQLVLEKRDIVNEALLAADSNNSRKVSLIDVMIAKIAVHEGCEYCVTFDSGAARIAGMRLLS